MIGVPMKEMEPDVDSEELVLVQGIIDLYMEEEDGLVLLDYKTDYVEAGKEDMLVNRYKEQLLWYKRALEQMTGKPVKETLIYSFGLSKTLVVDK
jgi:ATP-dependent helicase/nuclease subunit A